MKLAKDRAPWPMVQTGLANASVGTAHALHIVPFDPGLERLDGLQSSLDVV